MAGQDIPVGVGEVDVQVGQPEVRATGVGQVVCPVHFRRGQNNTWRGKVSDSTAGIDVR